MSNQQNKKIFTRTARPQTIAGAMGGIANIAAIKKMRDGRFNITLRPTNPAFTLQLSYMSDEIKNKINKYFGRDAVAKISFRK